jgi:hypothetical protein
LEHGDWCVVAAEFIPTGTAGTGVDAPGKRGGWGPWFPTLSQSTRKDGARGIFLASCPVHSNRESTRPVLRIRMTARMGTSKRGNTPFWELFVPFWNSCQSIEAGIVQLSC